MTVTQSQPAEVAQAFARVAPAERAHLYALRQLILQQAAALPQVGRIEETLKWGQPAYLTPETKAGTTLRLAVTKAGDIALLMHCQTSLIADFAIGPGQGLRFDGTRAVLMAPDQALPLAPLRSLVRRALTYHLPPK